MASFTAGTTFVDGVSNDVTAAKLGALVTNATPTSGFIQDRTAETVTATNDTLLIGDASDSNNLKRITVANFAQTLPTAKVTTGTIETGTFGTTTSTAATITTGTIETGTFGTTTSTAQIVTSGTFLGAITGSTNVINIGSGQIYKDASGNVGVGVTPSGWGASEYKAIQVGIGGSISGRVSGGDQDKVNVAANVYHDGTNFRYMASDESTIYQQTGGIHIFSNAPSGTAGSTATFTERLRIDSSGNVGIGTTSPSGPLHIRGAAGRFAFPATSGATQSNGLTLRLNDASDDNAILDIGGNSTSGYWLQATNNANLATNYPLLLNPNGGNVGIGNTSPAYKLDVSGDIGVGAGNKFTTVSGNDLNLDAPTTRSIFLKIGGSIKATIDSSGGVTIAGLAGSGSRAVNASAAGLLSAASDASLKEEVVGASIAGLNEILQIHPKMYRWKDDIANRGDEASVELGFIANDVAPIIPSAAPMGNDGLYGFYDRSITAALVKAVQELSAKVTALEAA